MSGRFFTPPKLEPLGLKLRNLGGGGYAPSQYAGEATDGRHVYCRYRGGQLSVDISRAPGGDVMQDGETILKQVIGPPLDGTLSAKQMCKLAGITVSGAIDQGPLEGDENDLSGAVTFWFFMVPATVEGARVLIGDIWRKLPVSGMTETWWDQTGGPKTRALAKGQMPEQNHSVVSFADGAETSVQYTGFARELFGYGREEDTERHEKMTGRPLVQAGQRGSDLLFENMVLRAKFATGHTGQRATIEALDKLVTTRFPAVAYETIDVHTGKVVAGARSEIHEDPAIAAWISVDPDRMRFLSRGGDLADENRPFLVKRPAH